MSKIFDCSFNRWRLQNPQKKVNTECTDFSTRCKAYSPEKGFQAYCCLSCIHSIDYQNRTKKKFLIKKFEDKPRYCRVPMFFGGERQIHIMQPMYDDTGKGIAPEPHTVEDWMRLVQKHGQIVFSLEVLPDFIQALQKFAEKLEKENPK